MAPANQPAYQKDERVLCFHHEILYEAKILDIRHTDPDDRKSPYEYLVHYKGWKNTYVSLSCSVSLSAQEACSVPKIRILLYLPECSHTFVSRSIFQLQFPTLMLRIVGLVS